MYVSETLTTASIHLPAYMRTSRGFSRSLGMAIQLGGSGGAAAVWRDGDVAVTMTSELASLFRSEPWIGAAHPSL